MTSKLLRGKLGQGALLLFCLGLCACGGGGGGGSASSGKTASLPPAPPVAVFALPNATVYAPGWREDTTTATPYVETQHPGEYMKFDVQGTTRVALNVDAAPLDSAHIDHALYPIVRAVVDGTDGASVLVPAGGGTVTLASGLSTGRHHVRVEFVSGNLAAQRWNNGPPNVLRVTSLALDAAGTVLLASGSEVRRAHLALFYTDSLGELDSIAPSSTPNDATRTYPTLISDALGWEHEHVAFSGQGYVNCYNSIVPLLTPGDASRTTFDRFDAQHSRLQAGQLVADDIFLSLGTNDKPVPDDALALRVQQTLSAVRADDAGARLWVVLPLTLLDKRAAIASGASAYQSATGDKQCFVLDIGSAAAADLQAHDTTDGKHLTVQGEQTAAKLLLPLIRHAAEV